MLHRNRWEMSRRWQRIFSWTAFGVILAVVALDLLSANHYNHWDRDSPRVAQAERSEIVR